MSARFSWLLPIAGWIAFVLVCPWVIGAIWFSDVASPPLPQALALFAALALPTIWFTDAGQRRAVIAFVGLSLVVIVAWQFKRPSNDRHWVSDMGRVASVQIDGDRVSIQGVRDSRYRSPDEFEVVYVDRVFDLSSLLTVDYLVERFDALDGLAHTLLTFGFEDGRYLVISVEVRREVGEQFHPIAGLFKKYELMYVVGTEEDLIGLRTNYRRSRVWLYPIRTTADHRRALLLGMLERVQALAAAPEFYNSLTSSCTTNIVDHVRTLLPGGMPFDWRVLLPGYSGALAYERGLIDTDLSFADAEARFRIDALAQSGPVASGFSARIRNRR